MNDIVQVGDFIARIFWHFVVAMFAFITQIITFVTTTGWTFLLTLLNDAANICGLGNIVPQITAAMLPYWNDVSQIVNWMSSTFIGNGTLQLCLSVIIDALAVSLILRGVFLIYAKLPVVGKK